MKKILLIEFEDHYREKMVYFLESQYSFAVVACKDVESGINEFRNDKTIMAIICHQSVQDVDSYELFKEVVDSHRDIPFISSGGERIAHWKTHNKVQIAGIIDRDNLIKSLDQTIRSLFQQVENFEGDQYTSITFKTLKQFDRINDDVYIKLTTGRLLKLFSEGDKVNLEDIDKYEKKGIDKLFIERTTSEMIPKRINQSVFQLLNDKDIHQKIDSYNISVETKEQSLEEIGALLHFEDNFTVLINDRVKVMANKLRKHKSFAHYFSDLKISRISTNYIESRIELVSSISCGLVKELEWGAETSFEKLIYLAHIHDLTLFRYPHLAKIQTSQEMDEMNLTAKERELILDHPQKISNIIKSDESAPEEAAKIILQHHERNAEGFPNKLPSRRIIPFAAILTVAIDMAQYILDDPKWTLPDYLNGFHKKFQGNSFSKIENTLERLVQNTSIDNQSEKKVS